jgi:hypothetical protein
MMRSLRQRSPAALASMCGHAICGYTHVAAIFHLSTLRHLNCTPRYIGLSAEIHMSA